MPGSVTRRHAGCMTSISGFRTDVLVNVVEHSHVGPGPQIGRGWRSVCRTRKRASREMASKAMFVAL